MLETKVLEIRDKMTFIVAIAVRMDTHAVAAEETGQDFYLLRRAGYGENDGTPLVLLARADGGKACYDPSDWGDRTWQVAHSFIAAEWLRIKSGAVVDVEFILGETPTPKLSERSSSGA